MVIVGNGTEAYLAVLGTGSVFRNAISTDKNGDFDYGMIYPRDVRDEQITVAVESTRSSVSRVILALDTAS